MNANLKVFIVQGLENLPSDTNIGVVHEPKEIYTAVRRTRLGVGHQHAECEKQHTTNKQQVLLITF